MAYSGMDAVNKNDHFICMHIYIYNLNHMNYLK